jgi:hypothetical protein
MPVKYEGQFGSHQKFSPQGGGKLPLLMWLQELIFSNGHNVLSKALGVHIVMCLVTICGV